MSGLLDQKVAVITGGSAGIGLSTARLFLSQGAKVVIGDLQEQPPPSLVEEFGASVTSLRTDVSMEGDVEALVALAVDRFGGLDIMFNNAGYGGTIGDIDRLNMASVDRTIGVLLKGVIHGYKHATGAMKARGSGSILSTASVAGIVGGASPLMYSVCKAAVIHLARSAAIELAPFNIRSNAICPGAIATQLLARAFGMSKEDATPFVDFLDRRSAEGERIPRVGNPEDIAQMALFLASPAASFVTGQAIAVDGGYSVNPAAESGQGRAVGAAIAAFRSQG